MDYVLFVLARGLVALLQALPLRSVARLGRAGGALAYVFDARHRRVALNNLAMCFGREKSVPELRELGRENFKRIGESYACAIKTAAMSAEALRSHVEFVVPPAVSSQPGGGPADNLVVAIGHFGNFELYARFGDFVPGYQCVTTYRGLRQPLLNQLLQSLRERSGCLFFERRFEAAALKATMNQSGILLGLLADQHAGQGGLRLPFLDHECSTSAAPAIFALRYHSALYTAVCYRVGLAQWRVEAGEQIPTHEGMRPRPASEIMLDVNRAFEAAVRRDPANWFWVHKRWKQSAMRSRQRDISSQESEAQSPQEGPQSPVAGY